jgi:hypothetical protein
MLVLVLLLVLSGCEYGEDYCKKEDTDCVEQLMLHNDYYTQEEVDEMIVEYFHNMELSIGYGTHDNISICIDFDENDAVLGDCKELQLQQYSNNELDEGFEDVLIYLQELEDRIAELENERD